MTKLKMSKTFYLQLREGMDSSANRLRAVSKGRDADRKDGAWPLCPWDNVEEYIESGGMLGDVSYILEALDQIVTVGVGDHEETEDAIWERQRCDGCNLTRVECSNRSHDEPPCESLAGTNETVLHLSYPS